jgi:hypothetical protein
MGILRQDGGSTERGRPRLITVRSALSFNLRRQGRDAASYRRAERRVLVLALRHESGHLHALRPTRGASTGGGRATDAAPEPDLHSDLRDGRDGERLRRSWSEGAPPVSADGLRKRRWRASCLLDPGRS